MSGEVARGEQGMWAARNDAYTDWLAPTLRWTAYCGEYPVAHAETKNGVLHIAKTKGREVTHVVLREREYPFKHIRQEVVR